MSELAQKRRRKLLRALRDMKRRRSSNPFRWLWLFTLLLAAPVMNFFVMLMELLDSRRQAASMASMTPGYDDEEGHPNEYERGGPPARIPRVYDLWGYSYRPSIIKLLKDLSLPGKLGRNAAGALLARVDDPETNAWVAAQIEDGNFLELRRAKQMAGTEEGILAAWRRFAMADAASLFDEDDAVPIDPATVLKPRIGSG